MSNFCMEAFLEINYELVFQRKEGHLFITCPKKTDSLKKIDFLFQSSSSKIDSNRNFQLLGFFETNGSVGAKPPKRCENIIADSETFKRYRDFDT